MSKSDSKTECCGNCAWSGPPAKIWDIIIRRCELDGTGRPEKYRCDEWEASPAKRVDVPSR